MMEQNGSTSMGFRFSPLPGFLMQASASATEAPDIRTFYTSTRSIAPTCARQSGRRSICSNLIQSLLWLSNWRTILGRPSTVGSACPTTFTSSAP